MLSSLKVSLSFNSTCLFSNSQNSISISNIQRLSHLDHYLTLNSLEHTTWAKPHSCPLFGVEAQDSKDDGGMRAEQRGRNSKLKLVPSSHSAAGILWLQAPLVSGHVAPGSGSAAGLGPPARPGWAPLAPPPTPRPSQPQASLEGVKMLHQCKLGLINPFHQLQIYLLNPIKNMNMQMQTFFNSHFQGLGVGV